MKTIGPPPEIVALSELGIEKVFKYRMVMAAVEKWHFDLIQTQGRNVICWDRRENVRWHRYEFDNPYHVKTVAEWLKAAKKPLRWPIA